MLILAENKAINFEQVFYFSVGVPVPAFRNIRGAKAYALIAHHSGLSDNDGSADSVAIKSYYTEEEAAADLNKIIAAYEKGRTCIDLDT